ncbi:MAG: hypothetical protein NZ839_01755, partial [Endomicrobia bacterium]|nr:hypothetical protein [Endomicrobiia bacterium]
MNKQNTMPQVKRILFFPLKKPLKIAFATSLGKKSFITSVIVKTTLTDGSPGIGEIPTSFAVKHESLAVILQTLKEITPVLLNTNIDNYLEIISFLHKKYNFTPMTLSGIETSLFRAYLSSKNIKEFNYWSDFFFRRNIINKKINKPITIETDITIPFITNFSKINKW